MDALTFQVEETKTSVLLVNHARILHRIPSFKRYELFRAVFRAFWRCWMNQT